MSDLRYPIGQYEWKRDALPEERRAAIMQMAQTPHALRAVVAGLIDEQLDTPYRPAGWTVRQLVHHLADAHMNGYMRFKLALTEDAPTIKPYDQERWAELQDSHLPIEVSLVLMASLHSRWNALLQTIRPDDFSRTLNHPEHGVLTLDEILKLYAWHGRHHVAHISALRERNGWR